MRPTAFAALVAACSLQACSTPPALIRQLDAVRLAADLHVQFARAVEAADRAVMSDSDNAAQAAAAEAQQAMEAVQRDATRLEPILSSLNYSREVGILDTFKARFAEYRALEAEILPLAVENTNVKAQRLSFGAGRDAADAFGAALDAAVTAATPATRPRAQALAARATASVRDIQSWQAPHIAEPDDGEMTRIESRMSAAERAARQGVDQLATLLPPPAAPRLAAATAALDRFLSVNREIVTLSRRNSDVRSLALSLGRKRMLTALCDDQLRALQDELAKHDVQATR